MKNTGWQDGDVGVGVGVGWFETRRGGGNGFIDPIGRYTHIYRDRHIYLLYTYIGRYMR
jgi:hypothetical protein